MSIFIPAWINGALTPVEKLEAHRRGLRHKAVSVFVMRGEETLIQQRAMDKYHTPGLWANSCCTHPDWSEDSAHCAERRLGEELGLTDLPLSYRDRVEYRADVGPGMIEHEVVDIFIANAPAKLTPSPNPAEVMATEWVTLEALITRIKASPSSFTPWLRIYLETYADRIFDSVTLETAGLAGAS